ncbi:MAG: hypothetical protein LWY06_00290 [Firmicutes bacterium]|nr:hypothetical protein [Bacillota bacterium]
MNNSLSSVTSSEIRFPSRIESGKISQPQAPPVGEESLPKDGVTITGGQQPAPEAPKMVKVSVFPQDPLMDKPVTDQIEQSKIGKNLEGPRAKAMDSSKPVAIADPDGNFFFDPVKPEFDQASSFVYVYKTLDMHQNYLGHEVKWAFNDKQLDINSHAGEDKNAYYARWQQSVNFFHFESAPLGKTIQTAQSVDVVSHETGHATLDGMKPKYLGGWGGETMAYHEAFADCTAMLYTLGSEHNIGKIIEETGGDLRQNNRLSMLAEEFGKAIKLENTDPNDDNKTWLRNARNEFKYVPPDQLPDHGPRDELTAEVHSFSRVFSGAFYDCVNSLYDRFVSELPPLPQPETPEGQQPQPPQPDRIGALTKARDVIGPLLDKGTELAPTSGATYKEIALGMLKADEMNNNGAYKNELTKVFLDRNILTSDDITQTRALADVKLETPVAGKDAALEFLKANAEKMGVDASAYTDANVITNNRGETIIEFESSREVPLSQHGIYQVAGASDLYTDVYGGLTVAFDKSGKLVSQSEDPITPEKIKSAVDHINNARNEELIRMTPLYKGTNLFKSKNVPYVGEVYQEPSGKMKIRRIPIAVD